MDTEANQSLDESESRQLAEKLLQRLLDRTLSEAGARELLDLWDRFPRFEAEARSNYFTEKTFRFLNDSRKTPGREQREQIDRLIRERFSREPMRASFDEYRAELLIQMATESPALPQEKSLKPIAVRTDRMKARPSKEKASWIRWLVLPGLLLFATAIYFEFNPTPPSGPQRHVTFKPVASVESILNVQWYDEMPPIKEGQELEAEALRFKSGVVQLVTQNGVRVAIEGPADFRLNTVSKVFCSEGELSVTVPPEGKGFEVTTPFLSVVDLGTEFLLDVRSDRVEAHTIQGKIELNRVADAKIELVAGKAVQFDKVGRSIWLNAATNRFLTGLFIRTLHEERDQSDLERWREQRSQILAMPGLRLFFDFETFQGGDAVDRLGSVHGRLHGAQIVQGQWIGKKAVSFSRKNDALGFELPETFRSMTLFVSFRLDSFDRFNHVLLASRSMETGNFVWQLCSNGSVQLGVQPSKSASPILYRTGPVFGLKNRGVWYTLTTVVDAEKREIRTFLDGRWIDTATMPDTYTFQPGDATLGNRLSEKKTATDSSLGGRIDRFMLFDRPLDDAEIIRLSSIDSSF